MRLPVQSADDLQTDFDISDHECVAVGRVILEHSRLEFEITKLVTSVYDISDAENIVMIMSSLDSRKKLDLLRTMCGVAKNFDSQNSNNITITLLKEMSEACRELERVSALRNAAAHWLIARSSRDSYLASVEITRFLSKAAFNKDKSASMHVVSINELAESVQDIKNIQDTCMDLRQRFVALHESRKRRSAPNT